MAKKKNHKIIKHYRGRKTEIEGNLDYLISYFSYTLEIGNSHNKRINQQPKTIKSFISNLEKSLDIKEGGCFQRTSITLLN